MGLHNETSDLEMVQASPRETAGQADATTTPEASSGTENRSERTGIYGTGSGSVVEGITRGRSPRNSSRGRRGDVSYGFSAGRGHGRGSGRGDASRPRGERGRVVFRGHESSRGRGECFRIRGDFGRACGDLRGNAARARGEGFRGRGRSPRHRGSPRGLGDRRELPSDPAAELPINAIMGMLYITVPVSRPDNQTQVLPRIVSYMAPQNEDQAHGSNIGVYSPENGDQNNVLNQGPSRHADEV